MTPEQAVAAARADVGDAVARLQFAAALAPDAETRGRLIDAAVRLVLHALAERASVLLGIAVDDAERRLRGEIVRAALSRVEERS